MSASKPPPPPSGPAPATEVQDPPKALNLFEYTDYRAFLKDWYRHRQQSDGKLSYRRLAADIGFKSPGHFSLIVNNKANLSLKILDRFIRYLGLNKKESEFFQTLVLYNQAKGLEDKTRYFDRLLSFRQNRFRSISAAQYEFYEKWYYSAVREVLAVHVFKGDFRALGKAIEPAITAEEARKAIETLKRLGMINRDAQGAWHRVDPVLSSGTETPTVAVQSLLVQSLDLAKHALDSIPREERILSTATVSVSQKTYEEIREEVRAFRKRILEAAQKDPKPDRIYQFQFHVFPLSARPGATERSP
jgi:uncharacterized protein (TIGR02147 family)